MEKDLLRAKSPASPVIPAAIVNYFRSISGVAEEAASGASTTAAAGKRFSTRAKMKSH